MLKYKKSQPSRLSHHLFDVPPPGTYKLSPMSIVNLILTTENITENGIKTLLECNKQVSVKDLQRLIDLELIVNGGK